MNSFMLHFMVMLLKIYIWLTPPIICDVTPLVTFENIANRKNKYAKCVAYVPGLNSFMLHFTVMLLKIYIWLTPPITCGVTPLVTFENIANRKNKYARCVAYVPGQI